MGRLSMARMDKKQAFDLVSLSLEKDGIAWFVPVHIQQEHETKLIILGPFETYSKAVEEASSLGLDTEPTLLTKTDLKRHAAGGAILKHTQIRGRKFEEEL